MRLGGSGHGLRLRAWLLVLRATVACDRRWRRCICARGCRYSDCLGETVIKLDKFLKRARNEKVTTIAYLIIVPW